MGGGGYGKRAKTKESRIWPKFKRERGKEKKKKIKKKVRGSSNKKREANERKANERQDKNFRS